MVLRITFEAMSWHPDQSPLLFKHNTDACTNQLIHALQIMRCDMTRSNAARVSFEQANSCEDIIRSPTEKIPTTGQFCLWHSWITNATTLSQILPNRTTDPQKFAVPKIKQYFSTNSGSLQWPERTTWSTWDQTFYAEAVADSNPILQMATEILA